MPTQKNGGIKYLTQKGSIELGLKDIEEGRIVSNEDFLKSYGR
jgi:hypothetical protein